MLATIHPFFHDEGNNGGELEGEGDGENKGSEEPWDGVVNR